MNAPNSPPEALAMRMPRIRFTVRGIMVVVAIVAVGIGGVLWGMRLGRVWQ